MAREFDVWVKTSNTIYKRVPFGVVTDWAQQGRLAATDKLRPAGGGDGDWLAVQDDPIVGDFLFEKKPAAQAPVAEPSPIPASMDVVWANPKEDEDDDPDMIPLIDISLVLLIFFMMTSAVSSLSPIDVPQMKNGFETKGTPEDFNITIDRRANGDAGYGLRIGEKAPAPEDSDLDTLALVLVQLDKKLAELSNPPEVRFACHRDLASERVHDLLKELETRRRAGKISGYHAEVTERK